MRKIFFLICLLSSLCAMAQKTIVMEKEAGVYKIPCKVNGAKMKMIFDTGASSVSISLSIAEYLYENDYITKNDIIGTGQAKVADGRIVNNLIINLRDIEIDGVHVYNVQATVSESLTAPLLFGQSAIQKLGKISLHGNILTIENAYDENASEEKFNEIGGKAWRYFEQENYYLASRNLLEMERLFGLTGKGYYMLCDSYYNLGEYENCYEAGVRFEQNCREELDSEDAGNLYQTVAFALINRNEEECIKWARKAIGTFGQYNRTGKEIAGLYFNIAASSANLKDYLESLISYEKAIEIQCKFLRIPNEGITNDKNLALFYYGYAVTLQEYYKDEKNTNAIKYLRKAVQCGSEDAKEWLKSLGY